MEDIAVHIAPKDAFHCLFNGIDLIGAHDQQDRFRLLDNKVTSKQFGDIELCEKILCEVNEPVDSLILLVSPIEDQGFKDALVSRTILGTFIHVGKILCLC